MGKRIAILGSTGSIGTQALDVISCHPGSFGLEVLTANSNADLLIAQAAEFRPKVVVIADKSLRHKVEEALLPLGIKVHAGEESVSQIVTMDSIDIVLNALVGFKGLKPTMNALGSGKDVALANKETLVVAGRLVMQLAKEMRSNVIPVDSEHSAIFQCLVGEDVNPVEKIILTASGGPFRGKDRKFLTTVSREQALTHPNWKMGNKITIDSATLMNKGLEMIEALWLFDLEPAQIDVVVHPQSIIHSMVQFRDGSIKAQMGLPDMRLPITYALSFPNRLPSALPRFNFADYPQLTFEQPDKKVFRNLQLAYTAMENGGNCPCVLNAANESVVSAFLDGRISFTAMPDIIESCLGIIPFVNEPRMEDLEETDTMTRRKAEEIIKYL